MKPPRSHTHFAKRSFTRGKFVFHYQSQVQEMNSATCVRLKLMTFKSVLQLCVCVCSVHGCTGAFRGWRGFGFLAFVKVDSSIVQVQGLRLGVYLTSMLWYTEKRGVWASYGASGRIQHYFYVHMCGEFDLLVFNLHSLAFHRATALKIDRSMCVPLLLSCVTVNFRRKQSNLAFWKRIRSKWCNKNMTSKMCGFPGEKELFLF